MDDAAAKKKKRAAAKKKRNKRNKAAAKHEKTKLMSWLSGGMISVIMMVAFSFITTPIVTLSLIQPSDGSGEGNASALPPSASRYFRQENLNSDNEASTSPDIIRSPSAAVVPPPVFAPTDVSNRRMRSDEMSASIVGSRRMESDETPTLDTKTKERNALSDFYDSTKGAEWTDSTNWLDDTKSYCEWHGVTCDEGENHVIKLELDNNGLSGRLRESIGNFAFIEKLDLSDNDIKGSIPTEIGLLSELTYLRLSYNAFTGTAEGLGELANLQLLHLNSNRITEMPNMAQFEIVNSKSAFVTDCGVPSAFDEAPECKDCTMCCEYYSNVAQFALYRFHDSSYQPTFIDATRQEETKIAKAFGMNYGEFGAVFIASFIIFCCVVALSLYLYHCNKRKNPTSRERRQDEDDTYALSRIGKESVYSYFVTDKPIGWLAAFATLGIQVGILAFFVIASEANDLQDEKIDIIFTWKCPRDSDVCKHRADWTNAGWFIFGVLMTAFLAKDMINGCKLIYHSSKVRHTFGSRIRYLIAGTSLCSITVFALNVSCSNDVYYLNPIAPD
eukprot:scaffold18734_cov115-Skeletonema_dohrnii-CCMP3373.AAC.8